MFPCSDCCFHKIVLIVGPILVISAAEAGHQNDYPVKFKRFCTSRLPTSIVPLEYDVELTFSNEFKHITSQVDIYVQFRHEESNKSPAVNMREALQSGCCHLFGSSKEMSPEAKDGIALHWGNDVMTSSKSDIRVTVAKTIRELRRYGGETWPIKEIVDNSGPEKIRLIRFQKNLPPAGSYARISINYRISDYRRSAGPIYKGTLLNEEAWRINQYYVIHLEHGRARDLFPCFEEPNFKAKMSVTVNQQLLYDYDYLPFKVLTSTPILDEGNIFKLDRLSGDRIRYYQTRFKPTKHPVPVSSLALAIGRYPEQGSNYNDKISAPNPVKINLFEPAGHSGEGKFAAEFASNVVDWFVSYLPAIQEHIEHQSEYINLVGVPPIENARNSTSALNLGLINHECLLIDESMSSPERKIETVLNVALVIARQWFGAILVSRYPEDYWITEGLALHLAIRAINHYKPDYQIDQYLTTNMRWQALLARIVRAAPAPRQQSNGERDLVRLVRAERIFQVLRANVLGGDDELFDGIVRSLFARATTTDGLVERSDLVKLVAYATGGRYSSQQLDTMLLEMMEHGSARLLTVDLEHDLIRFRHKLNKALIWPLTMRVEFNRLADDENNGESSIKSMIEVPLGEFEQGKNEIVIRLPEWFNCDSENDWLRIELGAGQLLPYNRFYYSSHILSRLAKAIKSGKLSSKHERIEFLSQRRSSFDIDSKFDAYNRYRDEAYELPSTIDKYDLLEIYKNESDPDVLLELLRVLQSHAFRFRQELKQLYKRLGGLSAKCDDGGRGEEKCSMSMQRVKSKLAETLVNLQDPEVIEDAVNEFDSGLDNMAAFIRQPVYLAIGKLYHRNGKDKKRRDILLDRQEAVFFDEERMRIERNLRID